MGSRYLTRDEKKKYLALSVLLLLFFFLRANAIENAGVVLMQPGRHNSEDIDFVSADLTFVSRGDLAQFNSI